MADKVLLDVVPSDEANTGCHFHEAVVVTCTEELAYQQAKEADNLLQKGVYLDFRVDNYAVSGFGGLIR
ncbi:hypothetical protein Syun_025028 [Stephania yunnanensis]|uniref:Uncharacterized protein n=1 Tax=Stephania yunnanensis TaxID=152371 RepID=A0AAP0EWG8_9MAGN